MTSFGHVPRPTIARLVGAIASLTLATTLVHSAPSISGVSGDATEGGTISVSGSGFGNGPNIILYDDFNGGSVGQPLSLNKALVGDWTEAAGKTPLYSGTARSGSTSMRIYNDGSPNILTKVFPTPATEVFLSFWVRVPDGTPFPGSTGGVKKFSGDSSWKFAWLIDTSYDGSSSDLCIPTHIGSGSFYLAGNDYSMVKLPNGSNWWSWNNWMRMTIWLRANTSNPAGAGEYIWHVVSADRGQTTVEASTPVFDSDGPSQKAYRYLNLPGWIRTKGESQPVYDDVYVATGANAQARLEIGDADTYSASKHLALTVPQSWSSSAITAKLPSASLVKGGSAYLYITDKDGNVNQKGYPLKTQIAPNPPSQVAVQ